MNKAVFLDRDGVINEMVYYRDMAMVDSPFIPKQVHLLPNIGQAIKILNRLGFKVIVVSNQPGIARGHFTKKTLILINNKIKKELAKEKAFLDAIYYCPHDPAGKNRRYKKNCNCRKPKAGLLLEASEKFNIDFRNSYMIGDELTDIQAGESVNCKTILLGKMKCQTCRLINIKGISPDLIVSDLLTAAKYIECNNQKQRFIDIADRELNDKILFKEDLKW